MARSKYSGTLPRKKPGPPKRTGDGTPIMLRLQEDVMGIVNESAKAWKVTRQEAIRRMILARPLSSPHYR